MKRRTPEQRLAAIVSKREKAKRDAMEKRLEQIEKLLAIDTGVHPPGCNCAIMSRDDARHHKACPYRMLKEVIPFLRSTLGEAHE